MVMLRILLKINFDKILSHQ
uniref:Uncharacterized protein n=1 Tax=Rhizophora mucronata TaxID=61149 RepID=A0A2P2PS97_RHIMU